MFWVESHGSRRDSRESRQREMKLGAQSCCGRDELELERETNSDRSSHGSDSFSSSSSRANTRGALTTLNVDGAIFTFFNEVETSFWPIGLSKMEAELKLYIMRER